MSLPRTPPTGESISTPLGCISIAKKDAGEAWGRVRRAGLGEGGSARWGRRMGLVSLGVAAPM